MLAFGTEEHASRFPDIEWKITAGNSSRITDGAIVHFCRLTRICCSVHVSASHRAASAASPSLFSAAA